jgi:hypothetical protein
VSKPDEYMEIDNGSPSSPNLVKSGKGTTSKERREIENLIKEYHDFFTWLYDNLKNYPGNTIQQTIDKVVMEFLEEKIITRFKEPAKIKDDNVKDFNPIELSTFCFDYGVVQSHSSNYYPQGNDLVESSNKNLMTVIKKTVGDNKKIRDSKIK